MALTEYVLIRLSKMIEECGESTVLRIFLDYRPVNQSSVDDFLTKSDITMEKKGECKTYLAMNPSNLKILGFFSVGIKCLAIPDNCGLSNNYLKKLNRTEDQVAQAYLLGQLSRSEGYKGFGKVLIAEAMSKIEEAFGIVGCRLVRLDCSDVLVGYYEKRGFHFVQKKTLRKTSIR